jgi:hypothetical protein
VPRDVVCTRRAGVLPARGRAAATATSSTTYLPGRVGGGSLASRSAVLVPDATPWLAGEKEANVSFSQDAEKLRQPWHTAASLDVAARRVALKCSPVTRSA